MLLHGVPVPEQGMVSVQVPGDGIVGRPKAESEFPVEKIRLPDSSLAGPAPDIQIESKKTLVAELDCLSLSWLAGSGVRVVPFQLHPKSQPRAGWPVGLEGVLWLSQKVEKAA